MSEVGPEGSDTPSGLLSGVTVLDLSTVGPAARCTRILADYGAEVVKVGPVPGSADPIRPPPYAYSGSRYLRRLQVDLKAPGGRVAFLALAATADVVVESFRPGVLDRLGVGLDELSAANPRIILCSTTGYGQSGPRRDWAGHDLNYLAMGGYLDAGGRGADGGPCLPGATVADAAGGGMHAAVAVLAALAGRGPSGPAVHLDVSVAEGVLWLTSLGVDEHLATGAEVGPGHDVLTGRYACYDTYRAGDGRWLAVGAIEEKFFANLCTRLGCREWIGRQFDDGVQDEIRTAFATAFASRDRQAWVDELAPADTCVTPVLTVAEVARDEQFVARGAFVEVTGAAEDDPERFLQVSPVLAGMVRPAGPIKLPDPGRSDAASLLRRAGIESDQISRMLADGVVA